MRPAEEVRGANERKGPVEGLTWFWPLPTSYNKEEIIAGCTVFLRKAPHWNGNQFQLFTASEKQGKERISIA